MTFLSFQTITTFMPKFDKYNDNVDIHLSSEQPSFLTKFTLDLKTKKATQKRLLNLVVERPSYNTGVVARTIAYLRSEGDSSRVMGTEIIKYDLKNEKILGSYKCQKECVFGEAFFVSSSGIFRKAYYTSLNLLMLQRYHCAFLTSNQLFYCVLQLFSV